MGQQKKYVISEETKKRCKILRLTPDLRKNFQALSLESFHFFYQMPALNFPLYFRSSHIMIEFMRPEEFSTELLQKLWQGTQSGFIDTEVCILKKDFELYQQALSEVRKLKYAKLKETVPLLDQKVLDLFQNLSSASQMIVRGGIDDNVVQKVKASAAHMVNNLMDSESAISTLTRMVLCDPTLYDHSASVAMIASVIGKFILKNPLSARENRVVSEAALYHDVGKTCIPSAVLNKPDKLSKEEFEIMKQHTVLGAQELNKIIENGAQIEKMATRVALEHHERFDGTGYPHGRKG
nr:HD domain-containing protein [Oligoflexales bacterium]